MQRSVQQQGACHFRGEHAAQALRASANRRSSSVPSPASSAARQDCDAPSARRTSASSDVLHSSLAVAPPWPSKTPKSAGVPIAGSRAAACVALGRLCGAYARRLGPGALGEARARLARVQRAPEAALRAAAL